MIFLTDALNALPKTSHGENLGELFHLLCGPVDPMIVVHSTLPSPIKDTRKPSPLR